MKRLILFIIVVFSMTSIVFSTNISLNTTNNLNNSQLYLNESLEFNIDINNPDNISYINLSLIIFYNSSNLEFDSSSEFLIENNNNLSYEFNLSNNSSTQLNITFAPINNSNNTIIFKLYNGSYSEIINSSTFIEIISIISNDTINGNITNTTINDSNDTNSTNSSNEQIMGEFEVSIILNSEVEDYSIGNNILVDLNISNPTNLSYNNLKLVTSYNPSIIDIDDASNQDFVINESEETFTYVIDINDFDEEIINIEFEIFELEYTTLDLAVYDENDTFLLSYSLEVDLEEEVESSSESNSGSSSGGGSSKKNKDEDKDKKLDEFNKIEINPYMNNSVLKKYIADSLGFSTISIDDIKKPFTRKYTKSSNMEFPVLKALSQENPYFVVELEKRNETKKFISTSNTIFIDYYEVNVSGTIYNLTTYSTQIKFDLDGSESDFDIIQHIPKKLTDSATELKGDFEIIFDDPMIMFSRNLNDLDNDSTLNITYTLSRKQLNYYNEINTFVFAKIDESKIINLNESNINESIEEEENNNLEEIIVDDENSENESINDNVFAKLNNENFNTVESEDIEAQANQSSLEEIEEESKSSLWTIILFGIVGLLVLDSAYYLSKKRSGNKSVIENIEEDIVHTVHDVEHAIEETTHEIIEELGFDDYLDEAESTEADFDFDEEIEIHDIHDKKN